MSTRIQLDLASVEDAARALRALMSRIENCVLETGFKGTTGETKDQIDEFAGVLIETKQSIYELVANSQEALVYLSEEFSSTEEDNTYIFTYMEVY